MKVGLYTGIPVSSSHIRGVPAVNHADASSGCKSSDFDRVSLRPAQTIDDISFARGLSKDLAARLRAGASHERVMELKQQVESGTYVPDSKRIAEHLLGYR